jgi:hypothetical protein
VITGTDRGRTLLKAYAAEPGEDVKPVKTTRTLVHPVQVWLVVRVPPERWEGLPGALRPMVVKPAKAGKTAGAE